MAKLNFNGGRIGDNSKGGDLSCEIVLVTSYSRGLNREMVL